MGKQWDIVVKLRHSTFLLIPLYPSASELNVTHNEMKSSAPETKQNAKKGN